MKQVIPVERQAKILSWLEAEQTIKVKQLAERLNISLMTVHRDLDKLERDGLIKKVHGGAYLLPEVAPPQQVESTICALCEGRVRVRTGFTIIAQSGERLCACCPHCGLLLLRQLHSVASALTADFLHGRKVNVYRAYFVLESDVRVCCVPSTLCFATEVDARKFQLGFGGDVLNFEQATQHLMESHHHGHM